MLFYCKCISETVLTVLQQYSVFWNVTFPEAEINSMPRRAAAAFCLPARCGVGVPPWATASRKCPKVLIGDWEPSLLQVTTVW
jgi:hypothetical protein